MAMVQWGTWHPWHPCPTSVEVCTWYLSGSPTPTSPTGRKPAGLSGGHDPVLGEIQNGINTGIIRVRMASTTSVSGVPTLT